MHFADFNTDAFLRDYWQQKPLLIKNPWQSWRNPVEPDELAGLACEVGVESRLVTQMDTNNSWTLEHGPLTEARFSTLGQKKWTLLVQAVDHFVPEVAKLIEPFRFIPNWRIDDIMVSYAADDGGVGPHFDQYDVFLIQGLGRRRWQVGPPCDQDTALLPHEDLRLLANFNPVDEWICEPGDILYLPPGVAHNGVAIGNDCMTYSVGFRAPSRSELIGYWADDLLADMKYDDRFGDPAIRPQKNPGEIEPDAIEQLHKMIIEKMGDEGAFARWFGQYSTTRKYPDTDWSPQAQLEPGQLQKNIAGGLPLLRNPASRFSFIRQKSNSVLLYVDGVCFPCTNETAGFAEILCAQNEIFFDQNFVNSDDIITLLGALYDQGSVTFTEQD